MKRITIKLDFITVAVSNTSLWPVILNDMKVSWLYIILCMCGNKSQTYASGMMMMVVEGERGANE